MGTDIHFVFQAKSKRYDEWEDINSDLNCCFVFNTIPRDYALFAWLAGVRNNSSINPISEPRGLPADFEVNGNYHTTDHGDHKILMGEHSYSWLLDDEIINSKLPCYMDNIIDSEEDFTAFVNEVKRLKKIYGAVRFVFGFDS
jgi:hypothetical protein